MIIGIIIILHTKLVSEKQRLWKIGIRCVNKYRWVLTIYPWSFNIKKFFFFFSCPQISIKYSLKTVHAYLSSLILKCSSLTRDSTEF